MIGSCLAVGHFITWSQREVLWPVISAEFVDDCEASQDPLECLHLAHAILGLSAGRHPGRKSKEYKRLQKKHKFETGESGEE